MKRFYNVDVTTLTPTFHKEQEDYYIYSGLWTELRVEHVVAEASVMKRLDLNTCTLKDSEGVDPVSYNFDFVFPCAVSGFASWFTVDFNGSPEHPVSKRVVLSTGPEAGYTHWGQQVFYLREAIDAQSGTNLRGEVSMQRQTKNKRLYDLHLTLSVDNAQEQKLVYEIP
jgi:type I protein arginine methyltransferase